MSSMRCDICGGQYLPVKKYKCVGVSLGERVCTTIKMCICCDANTDEEWLAEQLDWDNVTEMK